MKPSSELLEHYVLLMEEELEMLKDTELTMDRLMFLEKLHDVYKCYKKMLNGTDSYSYVEHNDTKEEHIHNGVNNELVEERISDSLGEYQGYLHYRNLYDTHKKKDDLDRSHQELGHFLGNLEDMFMEIKNLCKSEDGIDECKMITASVKKIYSMFK